MKKLFLILALLSLLAPRAEAVIGGAPAPELMRHTVMVLSKKGGICSGALIAPRTVLTAAHCVADRTDYAVHFRTVLNEPILLVPREIIIHPDYVPDAIAKRVRSIDLAIITLNDSLPEPFTPVALSDAMPRTGDDVTIGGYGLTDETKRNSSGTYAAAILHSVEPYGQSKILLWLKGDPIAGRNLVRGGCHGDSGGPIFYDKKLVAITTWTTGPKGSDCGELTQGVLIAPQRDWIEKTIK
jgi:V8-like Glu-specific endopeptidase